MKLAAYLRSRRDLVQPADIGLHCGERRQVPGLRRQEVAMLAGISVEYYLRLEQGRERRPSDQVLEALARALRLDDDATEYMRNLARPRPRQRRGVTERLDPRMQTLINYWELVPAYIQSSHMTVLATNRLASAMLPSLIPAANVLRAVFLEPDTRSRVRNWDAATSDFVSWLRFQLAETGVDPEWQSLIGELSALSDQFRTLWDRHDVKQRTSGPALFDNPRVGLLELRYRTLVLPETRQTIVAFYAEPGSASEDRLRLLSTLIMRTA